MQECFTMWISHKLFGTNCKLFVPLFQSTIKKLVNQTEGFNMKRHHILLHNMSEELIKLIKVAALELQ